MGKRSVFFDLKSTELRHKTVADLILVMDCVVATLVQKTASRSRSATSVIKWKNPQVHYKAVCGIGLLSQFRDGTDTPPV